MFLFETEKEIPLLTKPIQYPYLLLTEGFSWKYYLEEMTFQLGETVSSVLSLQNSIQLTVFNSFSGDKKPHLILAFAKQMGRIL